MMSEQNSDRTTTGMKLASGFVLPYLIFLLWTALSPKLAVVAYPLDYGIKIAIVAVACWKLRGVYPAWSSQGIGAGIIVGVLGFLLWIGLFHADLEGIINSRLPESWRPSPRVGFDPWSEIGDPVGRMAFLLVRFFGLVLLVPLIEELFLRGWLWRYLQEERFFEIPYGKSTRAAWLGVTLACAATHPEYITAAVWCLLVNLLYTRTQNLWSCIISHAVTNLLLGLYIIQTGRWELW